MSDEILLDAEVKVSQKETSKIQEFITSINEFFSDKNLEQKSRLSSRNIKGINAALCINKFLKNKYNFENKVLKELVERKTEYSISLDGKGRDEVIELCKAFGNTLQQEETLDMIRKLNGIK